MAFDPLDGSSIIDTNFAVGTIFGVWPGSRLVGVSGRDLAAAGMAVYGPRTTMTVAGAFAPCFDSACVVGSHVYFSCHHDGFTRESVVLTLSAPTAVMMAMLT